MRSVISAVVIRCLLPGCLVMAATRLDLAATAESKVEGTSELALKTAFVPLAPGAIEPAGWLRDWASAARDGITGHLDEYHPTFRDAWKGTRIDAPGAAPDGTGWPLEQCSYWLDGAIRLGYLLHDDHLIQKAKARLNLVVEGVNRGGVSFIYWSKDKPQGFNSWAHSHMGRALVAWYQATGDKRILDALVKAYAEYPAPMGHLRFDDVSGLCNIDAMLETYRFSGDPRVLQRVGAAIGAPDVQSSVRGWLEGKIVPGHAVCAYEQIRLPALMHLATGDPKFLQASRCAFQWFDENHLLPYGVTSGEEFLSGIGAFRLTETCDVAAQIWSNVWLYRILGERNFGDRIERAFFNAGAAPLARDFQTMCYYQSPNRIQPETLPGEQPNCPGRGCLRFSRLGYPNVLCCVGAVNRIVPNYVTHMWMASSDRGLAATLYGPCTVSAKAGPNVPVRLTCQTAYPFEDTIRVTVTPEQSVSFPLYFRIPGWCAKPRIAVNGGSVEAAPDAKGFVRIHRQWAQGDTIALTFPMSVEVTRGWETEYPASTRKYFGFKPDAVFEKRRWPYESVSYGPLLFALAMPDKDPNTLAPGAKWQYALDNAVERNGGDIVVQRRPMPAKWNWPLDAPLALVVPARPFAWNPTNERALPAAPVEGGKSETIRLVPYGCTKFRISMFPVTAKAWREFRDERHAAAATITPSLRIEVDATKVENTMRGGMGASWHAIEQPIPYKPGQSEGGSAWGANPPAENEAAWQELYRHADWLGLDWCRVEIEQRMYEPERGKFDFESPEMKILYRILDWCERRKADVFFQQMWGNVAWNTFPEWRDDPVKRVHSGPLSMDDFAEGLATLMEHLIKKKRYTCIRWLSITNEPGHPWSWWTRPPRDAMPLRPGLAAVRKALDRRDLRIPLSGPDWTDLPPLEPSKIDFDELIGAYDIHSYWANFDGRKGGYPLSVAEKRLSEWTRWAHTRNKPLLLSELGTMAFGWQNDHPGPGSYEAGLKDAELVVRAMNTGVDGFNRWSFTNRGDLDGQWQLVDTWDRKAQKLLDHVTPHPNTYYLYGLLSRFTAKHSSTLQCQVGGGRLEKHQRAFAAALRSPSGNLTLVVVNDAQSLWEAEVVLRGLNREQTLYRYRITPADRDRPNVTVAHSRRFMLSGSNTSFQDTIPASSVSVYTTYNRAPGEPGVSAD